MIPWCLTNERPLAPLYLLSAASDYCAAAVVADMEGVHVIPAVIVLHEGKPHYLVPVPKWVPYATGDVIKFLANRWFVNDLEQVAGTYT